VETTRTALVQRQRRGRPRLLFTVVCRTVSRATVLQFGRAAVESPISCQTLSGVKFTGAR
jgi:hypothetical protein